MQAELQEGKGHAQPACRAEPGPGRPAHHPTATAGRPCATGGWHSPTTPPAPIAGGPWLVAAGPVASRRHPAASPSPTQHQLIDRRQTMSKLTRTLILGATLAAINLVGLTAVAHAQTNDPDGKDARRPATEAQVGEAWRHPTTAPVPSAEPSGQPSWLLPSLGVLAAALVLAGGLALLAAERAGRRARVGHVA